MGLASGRPVVKRSNGKYFPNGGFNVGQFSVKAGFSIAVVGYRRVAPQKKDRTISSYKKNGKSPFYTIYCDIPVYLYDWGISDVSSPTVLLRLRRKSWASHDTSTTFLTQCSPPSDASQENVLRGGTACSC